MRAIPGGGLAIVVALAGLVQGCGGSPATRGFIVGAAAVEGLELSEVDLACSGATTDTDRDGLSDACEFALASAFAPVMMVAPQECDRMDSTRLPRLGGEYLFGVQPLDSTRMRISYLPAYYRDCGWEGPKCWLPFVDCSSHAGDSEFIVLDVYRGRTSGRWSTEGVFLSAHCFDDSQCRWYRFADLAEFEWEAGIPRGVPHIWVSEGRHANYPGKAACDRGHSRLDTCDRNRMGYVFPLLDRSRNIGSLKFPFGVGPGCIEANRIAVRDSMAVAGAVECIWDADSRFRGWQGPAGAGATPYYRYLTEVAGYGSRESAGSQHGTH